MKKYKKKKRTISFLFIFVLIIGIAIGTFIFFSDRTGKKLEKLGYSKEERTIILESLNSNSISEILNMEYNSNIVSIIENKDFKEENFIIYIEEKKKSNLSIEDTIFLVNHKDYDSNIKYSLKIVDILKEKYYIGENLARYIAYAEKNTSLDTRSIVEAINANRDYKFYTNTKKTDTANPYEVIVNKYYYLDKNAGPEKLVTQSSKYGRSDVQLEETAYEQYKKMYEAAKKEGLTLYLNSAYRSYTSQQEVYKEYEVKVGAEASNYAAMPGFSEHQTGLALDIFKPGTTTKTFEKTKEFAWLQENAHKYGFILRYPKGKEDITGYAYESWHYRYVGEKIASYIYETKITFEEYYAYFLK